MTWTKMSFAFGNGYQSNVVGTPSFLYAWDEGADSAGIGDPNLSIAPRNPGTSWSSVTAPAGMNNGGKAAAVTYDGTHYIIVSGNFNAGIWRYVE